MPKSEGLEINMSKLLSIPFMAEGKKHLKNESVYFIAVHFKHETQHLQPERVFDDS